MSTRPLRVLVTGFEPFGGEPINPSQQLVEELKHEQFDGLELVTSILPVDIELLPIELERALDEVRPDALLLVGQATGRDAICLETTAINEVAYGKARDNAGRSISSAPVQAGGPRQRPSTLPLEPLQAALASAGHRVRCSNDAGRFLCNHALYTCLAREPAIPCAFVHVPLLPEQATRRELDEPSLEQSAVAACLRELLSLLPRHLQSHASHHPSQPPGTPPGPPGPPAADA